MAAGDAVIGINPASDNVAKRHSPDRHLLDEIRQRYAVPTQTCVLTHVTNDARNHGAQGAPVDLVFQSVAGRRTGRSRALASISPCWTRPGMPQHPRWGQTVRVGQECDVFRNRPGLGRCGLTRTTASTSRPWRPAPMPWRGATSRCWSIPWWAFLRAGISLRRQADHSRGAGRRVLRQAAAGLPMGCNACYTNHAEGDSDDMDTLMLLLAAGGVRLSGSARAGRRRHHAQLSEPVLS